MASIIVSLTWKLRCTCTSNIPVFPDPDCRIYIKNQNFEINKYRSVVPLDWLVSSRWSIRYYLLQQWKVAIFKQSNSAFNSMPELVREISKLHVRIWVLGFDHKNVPTVLQRGRSICTAHRVTNDCCIMAPVAKYSAPDNFWTIGVFKQQSFWQRVKWNSVDWNSTF